MINKEAVPNETPTDFNLKEEIKKLEDSPRRDMQIIGYYLSEVSPDIRNKAQLSLAVKRHIRSAIEISVFADDQLVRGFRLAKEQLPDSWTIGTAVKILTK